MPLNLLLRYNSHLDISGLPASQRITSLKGIFERDFTNQVTLSLNGKRITPTPIDGQIPMETLFRHLTTVIIDQKTRSREFEMDRSKRLHWVKYHLEGNKKSDMLIFSVKEPDGNRTYVYDIAEKYVIVLEPKPKNIYFLLSAYHLKGKDAARDKMLKKYKRKLDEIL